MKSLLLAVLFTLSLTSLAQTQSKALIAKGPGCPLGSSSDAAPLVPQKLSIEEEVLKAEREQRDAYLRRDIKATERLVADEFVLTVSNGTGSKATLLTFLREEPADPTLTLTTADVQVRVNGDTAVVSGKRIERRRNPDNNQEGVAHARYSRTYVKRPVKDAAGVVGAAQWQLLSEQLQTIPLEPVAVKIDPKIYDDYIGKYDSPIFTFSVTKDGDRLMAIPDDKRRSAAELFPESENEFFLKGRDAQVTFIRDRKGQVTHALVRINGAPIRAKRIG